MRLQSLRARLLLGLIISTVLLQAGASALVFWLQRQALYHRFDQALFATARALVHHVKVKDDQVWFDFEELSIPEFKRIKGPDYFQVWRGDGSTVARSLTLGAADLAMARPGPRPTRYNCQLPRDEPGRAVLIATEVVPKGPPERRGAPQTALIAVARETEPIRKDLWTLAWILAGTTTGGAVVAATLAWLVVTRTLVPVRELSRQIAAVESTGLGQRIDVPRLPSEVQPVADRLNEMLGRLAVAFERERAFTADVAHELRTPLAGIRSIAEVAASSPQNAGEAAGEFREIVKIAGQMQAMVEKLLMLARLDAGQVRAVLAPVNPRSVLEPLLAEHAARMGARNVTVRDNVPDETSVLADPNLLRMALANVIANAVEYVNDGGQIALETEQTENRTCLVVSNTGCSLKPGDEQKVFERFWRADTSRTGGQSHWGLGLSLVSRAMSVMGGRAVAQIREGGVFRVCLCLQAN